MKFSLNIHLLPKSLKLIENRTQLITITKQNSLILLLLFCFQKSCKKNPTKDNPLQGSFIFSFFLTNLNEKDGSKFSFHSYSFTLGFYYT